MQHENNSSISRRKLVQGSFAAAAGATVAPPSRAYTPQNDKVVFAVIGVNSRGTDLIRDIGATPNAEIAYICDVDRRAYEKAIPIAQQKQIRTPKGLTDFRKALEDRAVDAVAIATPDHWHAPAAILACAAGKHVYVEKPACHNPREGELMVMAARKHNRIVQLGTQRRSYPAVREAIQRLHSGEIGRVLFSRSWYAATRESIGHGKVAPVPEWLDYSLWQGPAPEKPYRDNVVHYKWHWFWHWGTGELGNNGIHALDVCRWGLGVDHPVRVTAGGGKYRWEDDQETPDSMVTTYEFGGKSITWDGLSWHPRGIEDSQFGVAFYGEGGTMIVDDGYRILDLKGKEIARSQRGGNGAVHMKNFVECIRSGGRPNAEIEEGVKSTLLCHLGNIAWRTGHTLNVDAKNGHSVGDPAAMALWKREYRQGWEPKV